MPWPPRRLPLLKLPPKKPPATTTAPQPARQPLHPTPPLPLPIHPPYRNQHQYAHLHARAANADLHPTRHRNSAHHRHPALAAISPEAILTGTLELTAAVTLTHTGVITPVISPTPLPTPAPRTVVVPADIPNYLEATDHFWFTRPFTAGLSQLGQLLLSLWHQCAAANISGTLALTFKAAHGQPIVAVGDGTVVHAGPDTTAPNPTRPLDRFLWSGCGY